MSTLFLLGPPITSLSFTHFSRLIASYTFSSNMSHTALYSSIGKVSFAPDQMVDNAREFINTLIKLKPATAKGTYIKSIYLSSTMSPGVKIDSKSIDA